MILSTTWNANRRNALLAATSVCAMMIAAPALAQDAAASRRDAPQHAPKDPKLSTKKPVSSNATINLVNLLVKKGILKEDQATDLIKQAEDEAYISRQASKDATAKADEAAKAATAATAAANPPGTRHVTYVPEIVKRQLRDEIKKEVMAKAEKENWASPGLYPEWASRIHFYGDMRLRYQGSFFPNGNDQAGAANFNAVNIGAPYDISDANPYFGPTFDDTENRNQFKLRARFGFLADLDYGFTAGMRLATGENDAPVSTNQTFGNSGGNFSKYAIWLDRAFLKWQNRDITLSIGRFDNPFWSPTDLVWYSDLGFDGAAIQVKHEITPGISPFLVAGAFPIYNTDFNAGINLAAPSTGGPTKFSSNDKWLFGGQLGVRAKIDPLHSLTLGIAYYDFTNVQGQLSSPCVVHSASDVCDTDLTRPSFAQKGNTYTFLRNIIADAQNNFGTTDQFQYYGLAGQYRPLVVSGQFDFADFQPYHVILDGEYVVNTAFDAGLMNQLAVNNRAGTSDGSLGQFNGGNQGWLARVTVGNKEIKHFGDWNVHAGYKYLESDATIDAFVDSDFGLGGTNLKGYFLGANYGISDNVWLTARWLSANSIAGSPYAVDVLQVDLNAKF